MKLEKIDDKARVWIVMRGPDGGIQEELDPRLLSARSAEEIADALVAAAGAIEIAETRIW
jgi:hypothetical protein